ncbi:MAG: DUF1343 domain-containing protein [Verrucomicrobia subdivision 3 bacterium]|nr:DUF1343 domain-containing protein [Limisphaerales bacterium]
MIARLLFTCLLLACSALAFNRAKLADADKAIADAIADRRLPGGVLYFERGDEVYLKAYGKRALVPAEEVMTEDTIFDAASLSKVVATAPALMLLVERGKVDVDAPVNRYVTNLHPDAAEITVKQLLTHTSGLRPGIPGTPAWKGYEHGIELACQEKPTHPPGTIFRYSDINFILLGEIVRCASGRPLNEFVRDELYRPLGMRDTGFLPPTNRLARIAPTEQSEQGMLRGVVHDPTARKMGGVAGHAGLFTTAADLARFARMMLNLGELEGVRIFQPATVKLMTSVQSPDTVEARRGLGWDIDTGYSRPRGRVFPVGSYGHTGWTGTCLWIDPFSKAFWLFLSNRVHPDGRGSILPLQLALGTYLAMSIDGFDFANAEGALPLRHTISTATAANGSVAVPGKVLNGIDVLVKQNFTPLKKLRIGLITNHTGADRERNSTIDLLKNAPDVQLKALFSPEHGIRGQLDEKVPDTIDEETGLPVHSLYGTRRAPAPEQLKDLDALVFDIQDIGCRFYTYPSTMGHCMEAAGKAGLKFFVLDRVNPINGRAIEGPVHTNASSFTAFHSIPLRHGMTVGELAQMFNAERGWKTDLTVVKLEGWSRGMSYDETGLPWINPSPNMRSLTAATLYPGVGLHESALSVGRGTGTPFEVIGAPYFDDLKLAAELSKAGLPGVRFVPIRFTPAASTFKDKPCGGVSIIVTDREALNAVDLGIAIGLALQRLYPNDFALEKVQTLLQHRPTIEAIKAGKTLAQINRSWEKDLDEFKRRRQKYLLY